MRSAQRIKISDTDLIKRLVIIVLIFAAYSAARTVAGTPRVVQGKARASFRSPVYNQLAKRMEFSHFYCQVCRNWKQKLWVLSIDPVILSS